MIDRGSPAQGAAVGEACGVLWLVILGSWTAIGLLITMGSSGGGGHAGALVASAVSSGMQLTAAGAPPVELAGELAAALGGASGLSPYAANATLGGSLSGASGG